MKNLYTVLAAVLFAGLFSGCCSYMRVDTEVPDEARIEGEKPIASFYVQNISYQILGFIPLFTGVNWTEEDEDRCIDNANNWRMYVFCDRVSLDNNIRTLKCACKELGSNRVSSMSHTINEDNMWSLFIVNRKVLKTSCFIMEPKKK